MVDTPITAAALRAARNDNPKTRPYDLAEQLGVSEAQLVASGIADTATRIEAHPDKLMPAVEALGEVMALTRNRSVVHEKVGAYGDYHPGQHAAMVLTPDIDLRIFPSQWKHAFAVEQEGDTGTRRSLQVFNAAGDAVHKIHLRESSDLEAWARIKADLATGDLSDSIDVEPRAPVEKAKSRPDKVEILRQEWDKMTDTHQFLRLCSKMKMNRLGAYRIAGAPYARPLAPSAVDAMLHQVRDTGINFMMFVGNRGCIQIHSGPIHTLKAMGPWQNVMDPGFNLHLRLDHVAEVWAVEKPTQRGPALSIEAFDEEESLIFQAFPMARDEDDSRPEWRKILGGLDTLETEAA